MLEGRVPPRPFWEGRLPRRPPTSSPLRRTRTHPIQRGTGRCAQVGCRRRGRRPPSPAGVHQEGGSLGDLALPVPCSAAKGGATPPAEPWRGLPLFC